MGWKIQIGGWKPLGDRQIPNPFNRQDREAAVNEAAQNFKTAVNTVADTQKKVVDTFANGAAQANQAIADTARKNLPSGVGDVVAAPFDANAAAAKTVQQVNQAHNQAVKQVAGNVADVGAAAANTVANAAEDGANAVWQAGKQMVGALDYKANIDALQEGDRYQLGVGGEVKVGVGKGFADGDLEVKRTKDGYTVSATGRFGAGALAEEGGELGPLKATATAEATQAFGGKVEMSFKTAEEAKRAADILVRQAAALGAASSPVGAVASPLLQPSKDELKFLANNISALELNSTVAGNLSSTLGLDEKSSPIYAGLQEKLGLEAGQTARIELKDGKPSALVLRQDFGGNFDYRAGAGLSSTGESKDRVSAKSVDLAAVSAKGNIRVETRIPLPQSFDTSKITDGEYMKKTLGDIAKNTEQRIELTGQGSARTIIPGLPLNGAVKAKFEATGKASEILTPTVLNQFMQGNLAGAAKSVGDKVQVKGSVTPYSTEGFDTRQGLSLMGVGLVGRGTAIRESQGTPLWQYQGTASDAAKDLGNFVQQQQANVQRAAAQLQAGK